ncbi:hypothetical protein ACJJTC_016402 [Scirpophaga incertulas]
MLNGCSEVAQLCKLVVLEGQGCSFSELQDNPPVSLQLKLEVNKSLRAYIRREHLSVHIYVDSKTLLILDIEENREKQCRQMTVQALAMNEGSIEAIADAEHGVSDVIVPQWRGTKATCRGLNDHAHIQNGVRNT